MSTCGICCCQRSNILECPKCKYISCTSCLKEYFKSQTEPVCPNTECRLQLTREIISSSAPSLLKVYKTMREKYLLDVEKARLPAAQRYVEMINVHANFREHIAPELARRLSVLRDEMNEINQQLQEHAYIKQLYEDEQYEEALTRHAVFVGDGNFNTSKTATRTRATMDIVCPCPKDSCRGFIIADGKNGKCGVCVDTTICVKCMVVITSDQHVCKDDDVASACSIKKQTRPCPKCAAPISKIDGCDQMWCILCRTPFSWTTGLVSSGAIHNPHFFAYLRNIANGDDIPRVADDVVGCDGNGFVNITNKMVTNAANKQHANSSDKHSLILAFVRLSRHYRTVMYNERRDQPANIDLRISFLRNKISEAEFAKIIQQRDKKYQKELEIDAVFLILFDSGNRIVNAYSSDSLDTIHTQIVNLIKMSNQRLEDISNIYKNKVNRIVYFYDRITKCNTLKIDDPCKYTCIDL